jgi:hypothetical protein
VARVLGVLTRPRRALREALQARGWLALALGLALVPAAANAVLLGSDVGHLALVDQWERTAAAFGGRLNDAAYAALHTSAERFGPAYAFGTALLRGPVLTALVALLVCWAGRRQAPGVSFGAAASMVTHASAVLALRDLVSVPVSYLREAITAPGSLGLWFPVLNASSPLARLLGVIDLFVVWWLVVLAIGVSLVAGRPARRLALVFLGGYLVAALALAGVMALADTGI